MSEEINYKNNPLNGVGLKAVVTQIVEHYGFKILFAYLNINCFKTNPSIDSSIKFLKKTEWAREKVEAFYLYQFKNLPSPPSKELALSPRDRIIPDDQKPGEPAELSLEEAEQQREVRERKAADWERRGGRPGGSSKRHNEQRGKRLHNSNNRARKHDERASLPLSSDPWAKARVKTE